MYETGLSYFTWETDVLIRKRIVLEFTLILTRAVCYSAMRNLWRPYSLCLWSPWLIKPPFTDQKPVRSVLKNVYKELLPLPISKFLFATGIPQIRKRFWMFYDERPAGVLQFIWFEQETMNQTIKKQSYQSAHSVLLSQTKNISPRASYACALEVAFDNRVHCGVNLHFYHFGELFEKSSLSWTMFGFV